MSFIGWGRSRLSALPRAENRILNAAANVAAQPTLAKNDLVTVLERRGEWYRVKTEGGVEGWVRWRYVDPDTGRQNIYVETTLNKA